MEKVTYRCMQVNEYFLRIHMSENTDSEHLFSVSVHLHGTIGDFRKRFYQRSAELKVTGADYQKNRLAPQ